MFTPRGKPCSAALNPNLRVGGVSNPRSDWKGKATAFSGYATPSPPPRDSLQDNGAFKAPVDTGGVEDWRRFREAGLLDDVSLERKDRKALIQKVSSLEKELYECQYSMGILLIEKKDWTSKNEELGQALDESQEILRREQTANLIAISEAEKREENIRVALDVENQAVAELQKALGSMLEESSQIKLTSESKFAEANGLVTGMEEKALGVEKKSRDAEAKLAEVTRKSSELEMKLKEVETRETLLQKDRLSFGMEREAHEANFYKQRGELLEWEKKLREAEERLNELRRSLNEKEERAKEDEKIFGQKERSLEEAQNRIDLSISKLKEKEDCIDNRLAQVAEKEREADCLKSMLDLKGKALRELEEKLSTQEQAGIQKTLDDQRILLEAKRHDFESELMKKRKSFDDELRKKVEEVEEQGVEIKHKEEKMSQREAALDKKTERVKEKEKDIEPRLIAVKEKEKFIKTEETKLKLEKQKVLADRQSLENLKSKIEEIRAEATQHELRIHEAQEKLKVTEKERLEQVHLQSELKQQLEKGRHEEELLLKAREYLKQEKERFEKEWEELDEKRFALTREQKEITEEKEKLERFHLSEEERLKKEEARLRDYAEKELEAIKMQKASLEANMEHERIALDEKMKYEQRKIFEELETKRMNFEMELLQRQEESQKNLTERVKEFEENSENELLNINQLKKVMQREMEEVRSEKHALQTERDQLAMHKEKLKEQQSEMRKDIDELGVLSRSLKKRREQFAAERARFLEFLEDMKNCSACGEDVKAFALLDLQLVDADQGQSFPLLCERTATKPQGETNSCDVGDNKRPQGRAELDFGYSGGQASWLRKVTSKIFNASPSKRSELDMDPLPIPLSIQEEKEEPSNECAPPAADNSYIDGTKQENREGSEASDLKTGRHRSRQRKNKSVLCRVRPAKAVTEDAKPFESLDDAEPNASADISGFIDKARGKVTRKRQHAQTSKITETEQDDDMSDGHTESVTAGGRRKRRETISQVLQTPGEKRYYLRRHKGVVIKPAIAVSLNSAEKKAGSSGGDREAPTLCANEEIHKPREVAELTTVKTVEISQERVISVDKSINDVNDVAGVNEVENRGMTAETSHSADHDVNGKALREDEDNDGGDGGGGDDDDADSDVEESEHPGEASIGKRLWTFFTT